MLLKIFSTALQVSPVILAAILGLANNAFSEVSAPGTKSNQIVTRSDQPADYVKQNIQSQKLNALTRVTSVCQKLNDNSMVILRNNVSNVGDPMPRMTQGLTVTDQPITINPSESIYRQLQKSDTSTQVTSISQKTNLAGRSEAVADKFNIKPPFYSVKASDLRLDTPSDHTQYQYRLFDATLSEPVSEVATKRSPQLGGLRLTQDTALPYKFELYAERLAVPVLPQTTEEAKPNKSQYNLFNPTPKNLLREFSTDRPDVTENPFTVDAGHFQFEADLVNYTRKGSDEDGNTTEKFLFTSTNLKLGLLNNVDFQLLFQPYNFARTRVRDTGRVKENSGLDILQARVKINIYGNDTFEKPGSTAFGIMPFINIPTVHNGLSNNSIEGGLIFPFAIKLSDKADLGLMSEFDILRNEANDSYHVEYLNTASLGYELTKSLGTYFEITTRFGNESKFGGIVTFDTGLLFNLGNDTQLDAGINIGLTRAADDINPFVGLSKRF